MSRYLRQYIIFNGAVSRFTLSKKWPITVLTLIFNISNIVGQEYITKSWFGIHNKAKTKVSKNIPT
jgi:hypothetical protein